jgi:hypothetical protein
MSEEKITLDFLAHQIRGMRDDVLSLKDDMAVLTAMVVRRDQEFSRLNASLTTCSTKCALWCGSTSALANVCALLRRRGRNTGGTEISFLEPDASSALRGSAVMPIL